MTARNYGLWGAIAGICLLALLGVRSAANWLNGSTTSNEAERTVSVEGDRSGDRFTEGGTEQTQTNARFSDLSGELADETFALTPLETAGTYVQRQKRAERDAVVATTTVEAVPTSNTATNPVPAQPTTRVEQPAPSNVSASQPSAPSPSAPAVPALW